VSPGPSRRSRWLVREITCDKRPLEPCGKSEFPRKMYARQKSAWRERVSATLDAGTIRHCMSEDLTSEATRLLRQARAGDRAAFGRLVARVYDEMRAEARRLMSRERPDHALDAERRGHSIECP